MLKYDKDLFEHIIQSVDLVDLISNYVNLERAGINFKGKCPFHNEKTASFIVSQEFNNFKCFGCQEHGDAISFVMKHLSLSFFDALNFLVEKYNIDVSSFRSEKQVVANNDRKKILEINKKACEFFIQNLQSSNLALNYLKSRKLNKKTIEAFNLGYSLNSWDSLKKHLNSMSYSDDILIKAGLLNSNNNNCYDRFRNRLMFPILDLRGNVLGFGARALSDNDNPKYLNSPETVAFKKNRILYGENFAWKSKQKDYVLVVEGYMDAISLWQGGFDNTIASMGTAFTDSQVNSVQKRYKKMVFAYDMDEAGRNAIDRSIDIIKKYNLEIKVLDLDKAKDPDEYIQKFGSNAFLSKIENALNLITYKISRLMEGVDLNNSNDKLKFLNRAVLEILNTDNKLEREVFIEELSLKAYIDKVVIEQEIVRLENDDRLIKKTENKYKEKTHIDDYDYVSEVFFEEEKSKEKLLFEKIEDTILSSILYSKEYYDFVSENLNCFYSEENQRISEKIKKIYEENDELNIEKLLEYLNIKEVERCQSLLNDYVAPNDITAIDKLILRRELEYYSTKVAEIDKSLETLKFDDSLDANLKIRELQTKRLEILKNIKILRE